MGALFAGSECVIEKARARHDAYNSVYAGETSTAQIATILTVYYCEFLCTCGRIQQVPGTVYFCLHGFQNLVLPARMNVFVISKEQLGPNQLLPMQDALQEGPLPTVQDPRACV